VTSLVHGAEQVSRAERASSVLFGEDIATLSAEQVLAVFADVSSSTVPLASFEQGGVPLVDLLADPQVKLAGSKSEARRLVQSGGVYVNNRRVSDPQLKLTRDLAIEGRLFVLRKGQKLNHVVRLA
jgi:tyrosyl-tRNA synthetase